MEEVPICKSMDVVDIIDWMLIAATRIRDHLIINPTTI